MLRQRPNLAPGGVLTGKCYIYWWWCRLSISGDCYPALEWETDQSLRTGEGICKQQRRTSGGGWLTLPRKYFDLTEQRLQDFDICYGAKELILNADFTLEQGRRYGLVGRNGIGKSVLLRCLSDGHLKLPDRLTCLHVEQVLLLLLPHPLLPLHEPNSGWPLFMDFALDV